MTGEQLDRAEGVPFARHVLVHAVNAASAAALETAINTWLAAAGQAKLVGIQYRPVSATDQNALILYTE